MDKPPKELAFSLRYYFVWLFCSILIFSCLIGILLAALLNYYILSSHDIHLIAAIACFISIVIGFLCIWYGSIYLTRPISQLNDAVTRVSKGDLSVQIDRRKYPHQKAAFHNEIDELAHNFNTMTKDLQQIEIMRQEFISNVSHELKTPVASLSGISEILLDKTVPEKEQQEFISNVSHELKTPVASLSGISEILLDKTVPEKEQQELLELMQSETKRLSRLCDDLLNLSRLEKGDYQVQSVRIDEQLRHALILLAEKWQDKELQIDFQSDAVTLETIPDLCMQIWTNLIDNAIKYSKPSLPVDLSIFCEEHDNMVEVIIRDKGIGMSDAVKHRMFEEFYQAESSHSQQGYGLGLTIVKKISQRLGAKLAVDSILGEGTEVVVCFPKSMSES
ncbi:sensor histidine kinase [Streptococcus dysgalactiae subsp. equisimilis]|uniref:HAMP domain-containing sensor histidine kinase n=1 Tax=Streptococcus dysgalactiae TaxID=1334 RepID=UPI000DA32A0A|nr:HAMP domain-containing sensor histidine kinase [Streptococcus dysgalactiae]SQF77951.1 sensor histidine kinase [Streptococcus dysgalactiae subsp. equisimilis]